MMMNFITFAHKNAVVVKHSNGLYLGYGVGVVSRKRIKKKFEKIDSKSGVGVRSRCRELELKRLKRWIRSRKNLNVEVGVRCWSLKNKNPGVGVGTWSKKNWSARMGVVRWSRTFSKFWVKVLSPSRQRNNYELGNESRVEKMNVEVGVGIRSRIKFTTPHPWIIIKLFRI